MQCLTFRPSFASSGALILRRRSSACVSRAVVVVPSRQQGHATLRRTNVASRELVRLRASSSSGAASSIADVTRKEVAALEAERDMAVKTADGCAQTATKLVQMVTLLEEVALEKVKRGDAEGARAALKEKAGAMEVLEKNAAKADINYKLAAALSSKIAAKQATLLSSLRSAGGSAPTPASTRAPSSTSSSSFSTPVSEDIPKWKWQQSLAEARERLASQEAAAQREGRWARLGAEASIAEAKQRIASRTAASVAEAQQRLREQDASSLGTLEAAQARLRQRDQEVLDYVRRIMSRYRRGEFVSEEELEFAFQQLEKRFVA